MPRYHRRGASLLGIEPRLFYQVRMHFLKNKWY